MKKKWLKIAVVLLFLSLLSVGVHGESEGDYSTLVEDAVGYESFLEAIPEEGGILLEDAGFDLSAEAPLPSLSEVFGLCVSFLFSAFAEHLPLFSVGIVLLILFKILSSLSYGSSRWVDALGYLAVVSSGVYSFSVIEELLTALVSVSEQASSFLTAALPVILSAQSWSGSPTGAAALSMTIPPILALISFLISSLFQPLCLFCYAASLCGFTRGELTLRPLISSVKRFCVRGVEISSGLTVGVFCVQKAAVAASDSVTRRGIRFALMRLLPMAGGVLTDGIETVYSCGRSLSGRIGVICVLVLFALFVTPCVMGLFFVFLYSLLSSLGAFFGVPLLQDFFADIKDTFSVMTSFSVCSLVVLSTGLLMLTGG